MYSSWCIVTVYQSLNSERINDIIRERQFELAVCFYWRTFVVWSELLTCLWCRPQPIASCLNDRLAHRRGEYRFCPRGQGCLVAHAVPSCGQVALDPALDVCRASSEQLVRWSNACVSPPLDSVQSQSVCGETDDAPNLRWGCPAVEVQTHQGILRFFPWLLLLLLLPLT